MCKVLNPSQSNSKKWPKKIKLLQMIFFLKKTTNEICTCCPLSLCKILKKFLEPIQSYEDVLFSNPKWPISPEHFCFGKTHYYYFNLPISSFQCIEFLKKILTADPELCRCAIFGPKMFLKKVINTIFIYVSTPFTKQNFYKILTADQESWGCTNFEPKMAHLAKWEFFQKTC